MGSSIQRLDSNAEVPEEAFDVDVIDMDFHVNPLEEDLEPYIEDERALDRLTTEFGMWPIPDKWDAAYAIAEGNEGLFTQGRAEVAEDVYEACQKFAIDTPIVNCALNMLPQQHHPVLKNAVLEAGNSYMLDHFVDEDVPTALSIAKWDVDHALDELDRWGDEDGVVAAYSWFDPREPWGVEAFDPVFEKLESLGLPLLLHGSLAFWPQHSYVGDEMLTWTEVLGFDWPIYGMVNTVNMIMRGVFDRYPDLNVVFQEAGHWWIPFARYRMDEFYEMHPEDVQITPRKFEDGGHYLDRAPSEYLRDNIYVCTQPFALPRRAGEARGMLDLSMASDTFLYSSDWPHQTLDPPTWFFTSRAFRDDEELRDDILHDNAEEILRL
ncbi:amidohydrolase family protein [Halobellus captivus]|uniref:amidohydrolase family protein n=1 Tax=Halobellus captivus TaxID=2592614 RepID=UPI0011A091C4|nr:amidohydrolase family protein [Halobellus captivus]